MSASVDPVISDVPVVSVFEGLVHAGPPTAAPVLFETAYVLGGSVAGLLAARVLADHARHVVVVERDEVTTDGTPRRGVPQDQQVHTLLPAGLRWIERWLPGFSRDVRERGATLTGIDRARTVLDGHPQAPSGADLTVLGIGRPLLESRIRAAVLALPNVSARHARATGLRHRDGAVDGVRLVEDGTERVADADFVVDATGRASRLPDWVRQDGYDEPPLERLPAPINYATAHFARRTRTADLDVALALSIHSPGYDAGGVSVAAVNAIEDDQWIVMLMGYGEDRPGRTLDAFRAACAELPPLFAEAVSGAVTRDIVTYHQAESRRRTFTGPGRFPARLVAVGDAVASFNPVYGQGLSSATLHASCLSAYLTGKPDLAAAAAEFFALQRIVVDAAWAVSAGGDAARHDALTGAEVPEEVRRQRWAMGQLTAATLHDGDLARAFNEVSFMLRHPATLADPALLERAVAVNEAARD